jgi:hypothetical protein
MRWLLIGLFVSVGALLLAAAGVARHIWLQHRRVNNKPHGIMGLTHFDDRDVVDDIDVEPEI